MLLEFTGEVKKIESTNTNRINKFRRQRKRRAELTIDNYEIKIFRKKQKKFVLPRNVLIFIQHDVYKLNVSYYSK